MSANLNLHPSPTRLSPSKPRSASFTCPVLAPWSTNLWNLPGNFKEIANYQRGFNMIQLAIGFNKPKKNAVGWADRQTHAVFRLNVGWVMLGMICSCLMGMGLIEFRLTVAWPPVSAASLQAFNPNVCHAVSRFTHHSTRKSQPMASQFHRNPIVCRMACPLESGTLSYQDRFLPETSPGTNPAASTLDGSSFFPAPERALLTNPSLSKTTLDNFKFRWGLPSKQLRLGRNIQQFLRMRYLPTTAISIGKMITSG